MADFSEKMKEFQRIREERGDAAFEAALREYAATCMKGGLPALMQELQGQLQKEEAAFKESAAERATRQNEVADRQNARKPSPLESDGSFLAILQESLPSMKSQAQFSAFMASFDALRGLMNAIFSFDREGAKRFKEVLDQSIVAATHVTEMSAKLSDVPEAATSRLAEDYKKAPWQFTEAETQKVLLSELGEISTLQALTSWWTTNRQRIDEVRSPALRNPLIDAVRAKKESLS